MARTLSETSGLRPEHYAAIGKVASNWAILELLINAGIWGLAELNDRTGACFTANIFSMDARMKTLISLLHHRGIAQPTIDKFNKFANDIREIANKRNRIVHDPWHAREPDGKPRRVQITAERKLVYGNQLVETADVEKVSVEIEAFIYRFDSIISETGEHWSLRSRSPESSPSTPPDAPPPLP